MSKIRVGLTGYCDPTQIDKVAAERMIRDAYDKVKQMAGNAQVTIVSGVSDSLVIGMAYTLAEEYGFRRGGVECEQVIMGAQQGWFHLSSLTEEPIIVGKNWGDSSDVFVNGISRIAKADPEKVDQYKSHPHYGLDAIITIGYGPQALKETLMAKQLGKTVLLYNLEGTHPQKGKYDKNCLIGDLETLAADIVN